MRNYLAGIFLFLIAPAVSGAESPWKDLKYLAGELEDPLKERHRWEGKDVYYYRSALSPGILLRMRTSTVRFFCGLEQHGLEAPTFFVIKTREGARAFRRGRSVVGDLMKSPWIVASFQGAKGWEKFDVPWFICLQRRPARVILTSEGLQIEFPQRDTGHIFTMPLYGYYKPPQKDNDLCAKFNLPSRGIYTWQWTERVPDGVVKRCEWWVSVSRAYPVGFQESFSINPATDEITFHYAYRWLILEDDWGTKPTRFAPLSYTLALAWKYPGFPMKTSAEIYDPDYFTAFGPYVGAVDTERLDVTMPVLIYTNELEHLELPEKLSGPQLKAYNLIVSGMREKFRSRWRYFYDHGDRGNFCWNIVADVWYGKGLEFVSGELKQTAIDSLRIYFYNDVLRPYSPHHGKYILHGPGIGSWGGWGDAGKFSTNTLQAIWAYAQYTGDWKLLKERWDLIKKYFITPEEANWVFYGRGSIAEMGDEAPPCSSYARIAWALGDPDEYLFGCYMFARELVIHYVKQIAGRYFYEHQPYHHFEPMPARIYPTNIWGWTMGWQVDGPTWGVGEHQSANRWVRFHDPDTGRFYRDYLADEVRRELNWYTKAGLQNKKDVYRLKNYQEWLTRDSPHIMTSLARLRSFLIGEPYSKLKTVVDIDNYNSLNPAGKIAVGYAYLRTMVPIKYERLVPKDLPPTPRVLGLQRRGLHDLITPVVACRGNLRLDPGWGGWRMPKSKGKRWSFGIIEGDFVNRVAGRSGEEWISYGCNVHWSETIQPRQLISPDDILKEQDGTPVYIIGPFSNETDAEITGKSYPPEKNINLKAQYQGFRQKVSWRLTKFAKGRTVDLARELLPKSKRPYLMIGYLLQYVWSPREQEVYLLLGHCGGVQAWVNGKRVASYHGRHGRFRADRTPALARLKKGWNQVLVKVESIWGQWKAQYRIVHLDRKPIPGLRFSAQPSP